MKVEEYIKFPLKEILPYFNVHQKQGVMHAIEGNRLGINAHRSTMIQQEQNSQRIELLLKYGTGGIFSDLLERITLNIQEIKNVSILSTKFSKACSRPEWEITEQNSSDVINNLLEKHKDLIRATELHVEDLSKQHPYDQEMIQSLIQSRFDTDHKSCPDNLSYEISDRSIFDNLSGIVQRAFAEVSDNMYLMKYSNNDGIEEYYNIMGESSAIEGAAVSNIV